VTHHDNHSGACAESEAIARNSGFKDFAEYDNVAANILMVVCTENLNPHIVVMRAY
jgi:hypothetical protein